MVPSHTASNTTLCKDDLISSAKEFTTFNTATPISLNGSSSLFFPNFAVIATNEESSASSLELNDVPADSLIFGSSGMASDEGLYFDSGACLSDSFGSTSRKNASDLSLARDYAIANEEVSFPV